MSAVLAVSSLTASVNEYGDDVREIGMTVLGDSVPLPADSSASTRSPSRVPVRMCAVVSEPSAYLPSMVKPTSASPLSSSTRRHRADFDSRHRHVVADGDPARLGEQRLIAQRRRPLHQPLGLQPDRDDEDGQDDADDARPDE